MQFPVKSFTAAAEINEFAAACIVKAEICRQVNKEFIIDLSISYHLPIVQLREKYNKQKDKKTGWVVAKQKVTAIKDFVINCLTTWKNAFLFVDILVCCKMRKVSARNLFALSSHGKP